ncbi:MAG: GNAT family N-acetyltransferase [Candidatus Eisenbacteria bacterium]|nr:GNAT family N-acetyltransferase [Candidatus Eisenbacteria bacterium]
MSRLLDAHEVASAANAGAQVGDGAKARGGAKVGAGARVSADVRTEAGNAALRRKFLGRISDPQVAPFVAELAEERIVGTLTVKRLDFPGCTPSRAGLVSQVWIDPEFRRLGITRRLLRGSFDFLRSQDLDLVLLNFAAGNQEAERTWTSLGFQPMESVSVRVKCVHSDSASIPDPVRFATPSPLPSPSPSTSPSLLPLPLPFPLASPSDDVSIRPARGEDLEAVVGLYENWSDHCRLVAPLVPSPTEETIRARVERVRREMERRDQFLLVAAESTGAIVGFASARVDTDGEEPANRTLVANPVWVEPAFRRRGVGRALFGALESLCEGLGVERVEWAGFGDRSGDATRGALGFRPYHVFAYTTLSELGDHLEARVAQ